MPALGGCNPPRTTVFTGMPVADLQRALKQAQWAYIELSTGNKGEVYAYTQGDGSKGVTYTRADLGRITALIEELQQVLGMTHRARRPISFWWGPSGFWGRGRGS